MTDTVSKAIERRAAVRDPEPQQQRPLPQARRLGDDRLSCNAHEARTGSSQTGLSAEIDCILAP